MDTAINNLFSQIIEKEPITYQVGKSGKPPTSIRCKTALQTRPSDERRNIISLQTKLNESNNHDGSDIEKEDNQKLCKSLQSLDPTT